MAAPPVPPDARGATAAPAQATPEPLTAPQAPTDPGSGRGATEAPPAPKRTPTPETPGRVERPAPTPSAAAPPQQPATEPAARSPVNPFLSRDPRQKARRLARALVSDMIVYQPEKRQQALAAGNLKEAFADEISKSWEEFVGQVGKEMASSTPFFTDALNEILAGGKKLF